jgi:hypothetical protein
MDTLQWNVNGVSTRIIRRRYAKAAVCLQETHLRPAHNVSFRDCNKNRYDHVAGERAYGGTVIFVRDSVHSLAVPLQTTIQVVTGQLFTAALKFTICTVHVPPCSAPNLADLQVLLSQLPTLLILLREFNEGHHLWGSVDEGESGWVIETLITRCVFVVLNMGKPTHISCFCLDITMCSPAISALHVEVT